MKLLQVIAQSEDSVGLFSEVAYSTFTFDLCSPIPSVPPQHRTSITGVLPDIQGTGIRCLLQVCAIEVPADPLTGAFTISDLTPAQFRLGIKSLCEDERYQCPLPTGRPRTDITTGGFWDLRCDGNGCRRHKGVDLTFKSQNAADKIIHSATSGQVIYVGETNPTNVDQANNNWGWTVWVKSSRKRMDPKDGIEKFEYILYAHLDPPPRTSPSGDPIPGRDARFRSGDIVFSGQPIADGDSSGFAGNIPPHLHQEVFYSTQDLQPLNTQVDPVVNPDRDSNWMFFGPNGLGILKQGRMGNSDSIFGCGKYQGRSRFQP